MIKNKCAFNYFNTKLGVFTVTVCRGAVIRDYAKFANSPHVFWSWICHNTHLTSDG